MKSFNLFKRGLSLTEVLVATGIIAVAVYGMIISLSAQQMAEARLRERKILNRLHLQLVREVLKNERDLPVGTFSVVNPALGNGATATLTNSQSGNTVTSTLTIGANNRTTSTLSFDYPYTAGWGNIRP